MWHNLCFLRHAQLILWAWLIVIDAHNLCFPPACAVDIVGVANRYWCAHIALSTYRAEELGR